MMFSRFFLSFSISLPNVSFPSVSALTEAVFGSTAMLSDKSVNLQERLLKRTLKVGSGTREESSFLDIQLFHSYLFEHFYHYGAEDKNVWRNALEYQLEYIIAGKENDRKNLHIQKTAFFFRAVPHFQCTL